MRKCKARKLPVVSCYYEALNRARRCPETEVKRPIFIHFSPTAAAAHL
jgi:hypothetical protein